MSILKEISATEPGSPFCWGDEQEIEDCENGDDIIMQEVIQPLMEEAHDEQAQNEETQEEEAPYEEGQYKEAQDGEAQDGDSQEEAEKTHKTQQDKTSGICRFFNTARGCKKATCTFLHQKY